MGSNLSTRGKGYEATWQYSNSNAQDNKPIFHKYTPGHSSPAQDAVPPDYPAFAPTLYFVDLTASDLNFSNKSLKIQEHRVEKSMLYLNTAKDGLLMLNFRTANPVFDFLKTQERPAMNFRNTKAAQVYARQYFKQAIIPGIGIPMRIRKWYIAGPGPMPLSYDPEKLEKGRDTSLDGEIYIEKDDLTFILPILGPLDVAFQFKQASTGGEEQKRNTNRASILTNLGEDICRISFDITEAKFAAVKMKQSRACQSVDRVAFFKNMSVLNTEVYVPIPMSTYSYDDPIVHLRRENRKRRDAGLEPIWMEEARLKRVQMFDGLDEVKSYGVSNSSLFEIERQGYVLKMRTGVMRGYLVEGEDLYEEFVQAHIYSDEESSD
ncbi:unnamed protein product [Schistocephalus solidus]|uniref:DUF2804 domain-containing protein n=1 Tax=Schistocephalus solidus TaxID=70667 RepID=A0A183SF89_SCHSO|nr:unnamed protein product [Schistocephalus solidus]